MAQEQVERTLIEDPFSNPFENMVDSSIYQPIQANDFAFALRGKLFLIVGPAGSGKSTLLNKAKKIIGENDNYAFPKRYIVRSKTHDDDEDFEEVTKLQFADMLLNDEFVFSWTSTHGIDHGILAKDVNDALDKQKNVVIQVSRFVIESVVQKYGNTNRIIAIEITADQDVLHERLKNKGLSDLQLQEKDRRNTSLENYIERFILPDHHRVIQNNGSIEAGLDKLLVELKFKTAPVEVVVAPPVEEVKETAKVVTEVIPGAVVVNENVVLDAIPETEPNDILKETSDEFFKNATIRNSIHNLAVNSDQEHLSQEKKKTTTKTSSTPTKKSVSMSQKKNVSNSRWTIGKILGIGGIVVGGFLAVRYFFRHSSLLKKHE
jgi:phosphonate metabolism protein PhnN/1,5-bisphosphokinase (PRPP-forming)